jgi:hypothetical protein
MELSFMAALGYRYQQNNRAVSAFSTRRLL